MLVPFVFRENVRVKPSLLDEYFLGNKELKVEKRIYVDLSQLTDEERLRRKKQKRSEYDARYRARKKAREQGLLIPDKMLANEFKTDEEVRQRKLELDRSYRRHSTAEEHEVYLAKERERKKKSREQKLSTEEMKIKFVEYSPNLNSHLLSKYFKIIFYNYGSSYDKTEQHHVLPKSIWPEYEFTYSNKVRLPLKAHFIAHVLLSKILPNSGEMKHALFGMISCKKYGNTIKYSKNYEDIRSIAINKIRKNQLERVSNGIHHLQGVNSTNLARVREGIHHLQTGNVQREYHKSRREKGIPHIFANVKPWNNATSTKNSLNIWKVADKIYEIYLIYPKIGRRLLFKYAKQIIDENLKSKVAVDNMIKKFRSGWIPTEDKEWIDFSKELYVWNTKQLSYD